MPNLIFIDDDKAFSQMLCEYLGGGGFRQFSPGREGISKKEATRLLAEEIARRCTDQTNYINIDENSVLFISIDSNYFDGVGLLTWLRLNGIRNHFVLYTFLSLEFLGSMKQSNLIIFAEGTSVVQLPNDFHKLDLKKLAEIYASSENLKNYLRSSFRIGEFRHRAANWWGMKQIADVYALAEATGNEFEPIYPDTVSRELSNLNNAVAAYLHQVGAVDLRNYLDKLRKDIDQDLADAERLHDILQTDLKKERNLGAELKELKVLADSELDDIVTAEQHSTSYGPMSKNTSAGIIECQNSSTYFGDELHANTERQATLQRDLESLRARVARNQQKQSNLVCGARESLFAHQPTTSTNTKPNILLIDDQALNGWEELYERILEPKTITSLVAKKGNGIPTFYRETVKVELNHRMKDESPLVVMLDLRLFDEVGQGVERMSGLELLDLIRNDFAGIPILIVSGSNKRETFEEVVRKGADAYWGKEGLDEYNGIKNTIDNFIRLRSLLAGLADQRYQTLRKLIEYSITLGKVDDCHWTNGEIQWKKYSRVSTSSTADIATTLLDASKFYKRYLHDSFLGYSFADSLSDVFILSALINKVCGIFEIIHGDTKRGETREGLLRDRGDNFADKLRKARDPFSHASYGIPTKEQAEVVFNAAVERVLQYLQRTEVPIDVPAEDIVTDIWLKEWKRA